MAPAITNTDLETSYHQPDVSISISKAAPIKKDPTYQRTSSAVIGLSLSQNHDQLLHSIRSQYEQFLSPSVASLDTATILNVCWILTVRCFTPARVMYLDSHPSSGLCHISDTYEPGSGVSALELQPEDPLKDLVRDVLLIHSGASSNQPSDESSAPETQKRFLTSAIRYAENSSILSEVPNLVNSKLSETKLMLEVTKQNDVLHASLAFSLPDISKDLAFSILHTFDKALTLIHSFPLQSMEELNLCSGHDLQLIHGYTKDVSESHEVLLHDMAMEHARLTPNSQAICSWDGNLTYAELDDLTSRLGQFLARIGVGPETFVLSCFEKSTWAIVSRLAILKAGGAYISIDATDPPVFLESVIRRVNAKIMLTSPAYQSKFIPIMSTVISITSDMLHHLPEASGRICSTVKPNNACLILFTSGSTGQPKGIIQEHRSYATAVRDYNKVLGLGRHSRVFQFDDYAFDISNNDYLTALAAGGCCCVPDPEKTVRALIRNVNAMKANMTFLTPTIAIQFAPHDVPSLELVCVGGEPMSNDLLMKWGPHVKLVNQYGMGEAATFCAYNDSPKPGHNAVVGRSGSGAIWIANPVSPELPMPIGAVGEILIEGPHLSRGYLDTICLRPDVGFLQSMPQWIADLHPARAASESRIYRSGDLGRYLHDGTVEHMGRKDTLLKLNGSRIESTEVEYVIRKSLQRPGDFVVIDMLGAIDGIEEPILVAFIFIADNPINLLPSAKDDTMSFIPIHPERHRISELVQTIEDDIKTTLPIHMMPSLFLLVDKIPRTKSNKTDRRKLHHIAQKWYMSNRV